jgi:bifunctional DNA-binding transcriptional regulator/antitoxin component of YhaV-PrlF toxin-antitoxin module
MMTRIVTIPLSSKGQITLPKPVRDLLGVRTKGDLVGFLLDTEAKRVQLTRVEAIPVQEDFTPEEYQKLLNLPKKKGGKRFRTMEALIKDLKRH